MARACADFHRAEEHRQRAAGAGSGLPAVEPGMPTPAGTGLTRRALLLRATGVALAVYGGAGLGPGALDAGVAAAASGPADAVFVSLALPGGVDSLSALAPVGDARYRGLRPGLALAGGQGPAFAEDPRLMWHPELAGLSTLHAEGKLSVLPAVGYDHPDQSHFTSRHFWEVGALDVAGRHGWLGRYLDRVGSPDNPLQGLSLDGALAPALATARVPVAALPKPQDYGFWARGVHDPMLGPMLDTAGALGALPTGDPVRAQARAVARNVATLRGQLRPFAARDGRPAFTSPVPYPDSELARRLAALAAMLAGGLPLRCVALQAEGAWDTHADQRRTLGRDLRRVGDAVLAFQRDLEARGLAHRVLTHVWSEFGRRARENASGTDHGAAGCGFLVGTRVRGQMIGEFPGLGALDADGNLRATSDFRALYCAVLEQWLGTDAGGIIPGADRLARPALLKA